MTDLHTHILPGMDDGANNLNTSISLLEKEFLQGVSRIVLTSHFNCETTSGEAFLEKRQKTFTALMEKLSVCEIPVELKLGAEVLFTPSLVKENVHDLCIEGTNVMLVELPMAECCPIFMNELLEWLLSEEIVPLIAHIERYPFAMNNPTRIREWVDMGVYTQINATSLLHKGRRKEAVLSLIRNGLAHTIASDTHSVGRRPPQISDAVGVIRKCLGDAAAQKLLSNADELFWGLKPEIEVFGEPKRWRKILYGLSKKFDNC